jgi:hypothetical protein
LTPSSGADAARLCEKALDRWAPAGKLARLTRQLQEGDEDACARAADRLSRMDDAAAEALAGQLKGRSHLAVKYLPRTGKRCEKAVTPDRRRRAG